MCCLSCRTGVLMAAALWNIDFIQACTVFAAGRLATKRGSTLVSQNADATGLDARAVFIPRSGPHPPGALTPIYKPVGGYPRYVGVRSPIYEEPNVKVTPTGVESTPMGPSKPWPPILAYMPQVKETYAYWEGNYGFANEHGLALGEWTAAAILGALPGLPVTGKMSSFAVSRFVMERCKTARCAVQLAGSLFDQYGLAPEDPGTVGAGEGLAFADGVEAWMFHVTGGINSNASSVWAAQRVPDDHVAVGAQHFCIRGINFDDHEHRNYYWSSNILSTIVEDSRVLQRKPACSKDPQKFDFQVCYGEDWGTLTFAAQGLSKIPSPQYVTLRLWYAQNWLAPSLNLKFTLDAKDFDFSVKPEWPLDQKDLMYIHGNHFEGSPFDMRYGLAAGPHGDPGRALGYGTPYPERPFALKRTSHSVVVESNVEWPVKSIMWFAADSPDTSVYVPFFAGTQTKGPYSISGHQQFRRDSAYSVFNFLNNYASLWWDNITEEAIYPMRDQVQDFLIKTCERLLAQALAGNSVSWNEEQLQMQEFAVSRWRNLSDFILTTYTDHVVYQWVNGTFESKLNGYPDWWIRLTAEEYDSNHYQQIATKQGAHRESLASGTISKGVDEKAMLSAIAAVSGALGFVAAALLTVVRWLGCEQRYDASSYKPLSEKSNGFVLGD